MNEDVYTWTPDEPRPRCPICGFEVPVELFDNGDPKVPFQATCDHGHTHTFQLDADAEE